MKEANKKKQLVIVLVVTVLFLAAALILGWLAKRSADNRPSATAEVSSVTMTSTEETTPATEESSASSEAETEESAEETENTENTETRQTSEEAETSETDSREVYLGNDPSLQEHPQAPERTWIRDLQIPEYSGEAYITLNGGQPFFDTTDLAAEPWELYYDLDELGRCTLAECVAGQETMPTEKRGSISSVKPTGWQTTKYSSDLVNGESLYNRCHLIAFGLCGETANKYNLITGTRYFNTDGINAFENMIIDYIRETGNHVRIRVTPVFEGSELVARGQVTEAWSVEDEGEGICLCLWSYNVQPGIEIDYATGANWLTGETTAAAESETQVQKETGETLAEDIEDTFVLNEKKKKIHMPDCSGAQSISEKNRRDYTGSYNALIEEGYLPDPLCCSFIEPAEE